MKLLLITPVFPYPPSTGSKLIAYQSIRSLAQCHEIDLISLTDSPYNDLGDLGTHCKNIEIVFFPKWHSLINKLGCLFTNWPMPVAHFDSQQMRTKVRQALSDSAYDVVLFFSALISHYLPEDYSGPAVLNMEDPLVLKNQRWAMLHGGIRRWLIHDRATRLLDYERKYAPRFSRVLLLNQADVSDYRFLVDRTHFDWVPYAVDDRFFQHISHQRRSDMIVISGNMNHPPNVDGVDFFCRKVFPLVRRDAPNASLWIVGARPVGAVRKWGREPQITITGSVPDIRPYLNEAIVSVCPVRLKIGTQTKVLEAMACGTPVVTTTSGNNGVAGISGEHLYVADDPVEMAERIVSLLRGNGWDKISRNGRLFVEENFTWARSIAKLELILYDVLADHKASS